MQVAQQAQRLAVVLADLVVDIAQAGVGDGTLGQLAVARGLHDGPRRSGDCRVDGGLAGTRELALRLPGPGHDRSDGFGRGLRWLRGQGCRR
ncbi:hypothetical protein D9M72_528540 [compost metagenome]